MLPNVGVIKIASQFKNLKFKKNDDENKKINRLYPADKGERIILFE